MSSDGAKPAAIRVLLVDDHELVRSALASSIGAEPDVDVVATAADGSEAVEKAREMRPDVVIMDVSMPGISAFEATELILDSCEDTRILFLSAYPHDRHIDAFLGIGANGFLTKDEPYPELLKAIRAVAAGDVAFSDSIQRRLALDPARKTRRSGQLSDREIEVLRCVAQGLTKKEVAVLLDVSVRTIDAHVRNVMIKLNIHDRVGLARYAIREGLIEP